MQDTKSFFTDTEQQRIIEAVQAVEKRTSGEVVPMIVEQSYDYPQAEIIGGAAIAIILATLGSYFFFSSELSKFLIIFFILYLPCRWLVRGIPSIKKMLIHKDEMKAEVAERAKVAFIDHGLHYTRDNTGILILISLFEQKVQVLADKGINSVVPEHTWDGVVKTIVGGMNNGTACESLCEAIHTCGDLLTENFPCKDDDTDELPNLIMEDK